MQLKAIGDPLVQTLLDDTAKVQHAYQKYYNDSIRYLYTALKEDDNKYIKKAFDQVRDNDLKLTVLSTEINHMSRGRGEVEMAYVREHFKEIRHRGEGVDVSNITSRARVAAREYNRLLLQAAKEVIIDPNYKYVLPGSQRKFSIMGGNLATSTDHIELWYSYQRKGLNSSNVNAVRDNFMRQDCPVEQKNNFCFRAASFYAEDGKEDKVKEYIDHMSVLGMPATNSPLEEQRLESHRALVALVKDAWQKVQEAKQPDESDTQKKLRLAGLQVALAEAQLLKEGCELNEKRFSDVKDAADKGAFEAAAIHRQAMREEPILEEPKQRTPFQVDATLKFEQIEGKTPEETALRTAVYIREAAVVAYETIIQNASTQATRDWYLDSRIPTIQAMEKRIEKRIEEERKLQLEYKKIEHDRYKFETSRQELSRHVWRQFWMNMAYNNMTKINGLDVGVSRFLNKLF